MTTPDTYFDLFFGYTAIWLILAVFIFRLMRAHAKASKEIEALKTEIEAGSSRQTLKKAKQA